MSNPESSLPENWVEKIWLAMRATYGAAFDRQWECPAGVDPMHHVEEMKKLWGRQLSVYQQSPNAIGHALDNLPPHPPNLVEFKNLCRTWKEPQKKLLSAPPRAVPIQYREAIKRLSEPNDEDTPEKVRVARRYVKMWGQPGRKLTPFQIENLAAMREIVSVYEAQMASRIERMAARDTA